MATTQLTTLVHNLRRLTDAEPADGQLLDAFARTNDQDAFALLVRRHGPMVMGVCRRSLGHHQDAEDAFQATFLVLARGAATIRETGGLGGWLHGVAYRVALNARRTLTRRTRHDRSAARPEAAAGPDPSWREVQGLLDEEVARLPEIYRAVFVACCLQERTKAEAAKLLGLEEGTVSSRLARARKRLQERLAKRGVTLASVLALTQAGRVSAAAVAAAVRVALGGDAPAHLAALTAGGSLLPRAVLTAACLVVGLGALFAPLAAQAKKPEPPAAVAPVAVAEKNELEKERVVTGVVLDAAGKPVSGASVAARVSAPGRNAGESAAAGTTDADGRFRLTFTATDYHTAAVVATAKGYGPDWATPGDKPMTLRLAKDQEVVGKVVDLEGRVVKNVRVRVTRIDTPRENDLAAQLDKYPLGTSSFRHLDAPLLPEATFAGDDKGQVRITGVGGERLVTAIVEGPTIASTEVWIYTRGGALPKVRKDMPIYQPGFTHVAAPTRAVVGVVRDRATKKPIAGAAVRSSRGSGVYWFGPGHVSATTDADGRYRLVGLPKGAGTWVSIDGPADQPYLSVLLEVPDPVGGEPIDLDVDLRPGVWARGTVTDKETGKPIPYAMVQYYARTGNAYLGELVGGKRGHLHNPSRVADAKGRYRVPVLPGEGLVVAAGGAGYVSLREQEEQDKILSGTVPHPVWTGAFHRLVRIDPAKGATGVECDMALSRGETFHVDLVDADGKPVTGTMAWGVTSGWSAWDGPNPSARVTLAGVNRSRPRPAFLVQPERNLVAVIRKVPEKKETVVTMQPGGILTGRLVDDAGVPRAGVRISVQGQIEMSPDMGAYGLHGGMKPTDADGRFTFTGVFPGVEHLITTGFEGVGWYKLKAGEKKDLGDVKLKRE